MPDPEGLRGGDVETPAASRGDGSSHGKAPFSGFKLSQVASLFGGRPEPRSRGGSLEGTMRDADHAINAQGGASQASTPVSADHGQSARGGSLDNPTAQRRSRRESALELFSVDEKGGADANDDSTPRSDLLGTVLGVFIPCLQNILGVILFIRLSWIVGQAGVGLTLVIVLMCCTCTTLTGLSLSAVATNGIVKGGGPYFLISRTLGPEVGVSIGICFYLGTSVAASMYILGAVETLLDLAPALRFVSGGDEGGSIDANELRVWGAVLLALLVGIVMCGVKYIARVGPFFLVPVLVSVLFIFIGILSSADRGGVPEGAGISAARLRENWSFDSYVRTTAAGEPLAPGEVGGMVWQFNLLLSLFFPSVTGIMAGSNRSAVLLDAQKSIPVGTLAAIGITTALYVVAVLLYGASADRSVLLEDRLLSAKISWPEPTLVSIGITLSTIGAGLQSLMGAPRLLQAMAEDDLIPAFRYIKAASGKDPIKCLALTSIVTLGCVLVANLDVITPAITMFFLMCYAGVNMSCFLLGFLGTPNWRPRWRYHHWAVSLVGAALCFVIMFMISYIASLAALVAAGLVFWYVGKREHGINMGDGLKSVRFQVALGSIKSLGHEQMHPKNWYPSPLVLCKPWGLLPDDVPCHPKLISFAKYLKNRGQGLLTVVSILEGDLSRRADEAFDAKDRLASHIVDNGCDAFVDVIVARNVSDGFRSLIQSAGVGNLRPNMIVMRYPERWATTERARSSSLERQSTLERTLSEASLSETVLYSPTSPTTRSEASLLSPTGGGGGGSSHDQLHTSASGAAADGGFTVRRRRHSLDASASRRRRRRHSMDASASPIADQFVSIVNDCHSAGKGVVIIHNIDKLPESGFDRERSKQIVAKNSTLDLYWLVRDGGLMLLLSGLLKRSAAFSGCELRVFCLGEGAAQLEQLQRDVQRFLYELRIQATVQVLNVRDADRCSHCQSPNHDISRRMEKFLPHLQYVSASETDDQRSKREEGETRRRVEGLPPKPLPSEDQATRCLHASIKLNATVRMHSEGKAELVLLSMPPPPKDEPAANYMQYLDALLDGLPPTLVVRGYRRSVATIYQ